MSNLRHDQTARKVWAGWSALWRYAGKDMETIKDEINEAVARLQLSNKVFRELPDSVATEIFNATLAEFVVGGDRRWWWEAFSKPSVSFDSEDNQFLKITQIVPDPQELIWFIAEDDQLDFYPVYEVSATAAQQVIGECYAFEYYLIPKDMRWLLCENHHNRLIGIGEPITDRLRALKSIIG